MAIVILPPLLRRMLAGGAAKLMKKGGLCASCSYSLEGLVRGADRCVTCPECGARWRVDALGSRVRQSRKPRRRLGLLDYLGMRLTVADDGGVLRVVETVAMQRRLARNEIVHARLMIPMREVRPSAGTFGVFGVVFVVVLIAIWLVSEHTQLGILVLFPPIVLVVAITLGMAAGGVYTGIRFRNRSSEYVGLMKARALCPACIESLEGIVTPEDSIVSCPECEARWRFGPAGEPITATWCAGCGYDLGGLAAGEGGAVRCPECGMELGTEAQSLLREAGASTSRQGGSAHAATSPREASKEAIEGAR